MAVVYRDKHGVEYESVPLPTNEVTDAVPLDAHVISKRVVRKAVPIYEGTDGEQLAAAPRSQRRNWTDEQWGDLLKKYDDLHYGHGVTELTEVRRLDLNTWREDVALAVAQHIEIALGGWQRPPL